ncbi:MAG TPA: YtxH domain-containing protein [candidate division Zixibacteria bacterium]|jgi:gas vesicle protein|nr:YtxH domain-containing protein [Candidatus Latescibacterota bacterium]HIG46421.1 YtxH domain-containing protein [candidate division Zixibacteria bacterium]
MISRNDSLGHEAFVFFIGLVLGALAGLAFGLLIAPHSGAVTRRKIVRSAGEAKDQVTEVIDDLEETGRGILNDVKTTVK